MNQEIYLKRYRFLSVAKNMGKNLSNKYGQKIIDSTKKSTADAIKIGSKRKIQKTAEATSDLIGDNIANKITRASKKSAKELQKNETEVDVERSTPKKRYNPQKKDNKLLMN